MSGDKEQMMQAGGALHTNASEAGPATRQGEPRSPVVLRDPGDEVAEAIATGDHRRALALCARQHGPAIGRLCMAITGSQAEADDLTQETLLTAHDEFASFRGEGTVRAWLLGIARRKCARHLERRTRREAKLRLVHEGSPEPGSDELLAARRRADAARSALDQIRPSEREALLLRYVSDLSYREVGTACGVEEAAARKRVSRAIAKLRHVLADEE